MKINVLIFWLTSISFIGFSQNKFELPKSYLFTRIGTYNINEINIGYGLHHGKANIEFLLGGDMGTKLHDGKCGPIGIWSAERFQTRTRLRGINLRTNISYTGYNGKAQIGVTNLLRLGRGRGIQTIQNCHGGSTYNHLIFDKEVFDVGILGTLRFSHRANFALEVGQRWRHFRKMVNAAPNSWMFKPFVEKGVTRDFVFDWSVRILLVDLMKNKNKKSKGQ